MANAETSTLTDEPIDIATPSPPLERRAPAAVEPPAPRTLPRDAEVRVYTSRSQVRRPLILLRSMCRDLWSSRELAWRLFVRDVNAEYRDSVLGYLWILLPPLGMTFVWVFLRDRGVITAQDIKIPYILFVLTGSLLWESFVGALSRAQDSVIRNGPMLLKARPNYEALLLSSFGYAALNCGLRMVIVVLATLIFMRGLPWQAIAIAPLAIAVMLLYGFMIGMFLAPISAMFRDVQRVMAMFFGFWFMVTPIVYVLPSDSILVKLNPVASLLSTSRDLLTTGETTMPALFGVYAGVTFALFLLAWAFYRISMPHIIARMGS